MGVCLLWHVHNSSCSSLVIWITLFELIHVTPSFELKIFMDIVGKWFLSDRLPHEDIVSKRITKKLDVWSFGVCLWEIYTNGMCPTAYFCNKANGKDHKVDNLPRSYDGKTIPDAVYDVMLECWKTCDERPSFEELQKYFISEAQSALAWRKWRRQSLCCCFGYPKCFSAFLVTPYLCFIFIFVMCNRSHPVRVPHLEFYVLKSDSDDESISDFIMNKTQATQDTRFLHNWKMARYFWKVSYFCIKVVPCVLCTTFLRLVILMYVYLPFYCCQESCSTSFVLLCTRSNVIEGCNAYLLFICTFCIFPQLALLPLFVIKCE